MKILSFKLLNEKKRKKKKKKFMSSLMSNPARQCHKPAISPLDHERLFLCLDVNFTTYFFLRVKLLINMKMLVFFLAKCVWTAVKTMVVDRKKTKKH